MQIRGCKSSIVKEKIPVKKKNLPLLYYLLNTISEPFITIWTCKFHHINIHMPCIFDTTIDYVLEN